MGRHLYLAIYAFTFSVTSSTAQINKFTVFPLCANNTQNQSEQLNEFHVSFSNLLNGSSVTGYRTLAAATKLDRCNGSGWRSLAAQNGLDAFIKGSYSIENDSVSVVLKIVNTRFVDKYTELPEITGNTNAIHQILKDMHMAVFLAVQVKPDSFIETQLYHKSESPKFLEKTVENSPKTKFLEDGKLAYEQGNFIQAAEMLLMVEPYQAEYAEAQFVLGKCVLIKNDFKKAKIFFNNAKVAGFNDPILVDYLYQTEHNNKPADWYDTEYKRKQWWQSLTKEESLLIVQLMNNLGINGGKFTAAYEYRDQDVKKLMQTTVISLKDIRTHNLKTFSIFTHADILLIENCKLESGEGIASFNHLRIISTKKNSILEIPEIHKFIAKQDVVTVVP
jgi:hypothetical protein